MYGNVREFTRDKYQEQTRDDKIDPELSMLKELDTIDESKLIIPIVTKGGAWYDSYECCNSYWRGKDEYNISWGGSMHGFRIILYKDDDIDYNGFGGGGY